MSHPVFCATFWRMSREGPLKVGLIGCGWYAQNHLHAWRQLASEGAELIGVAAVDHQKARRAAETFKVLALSGRAAAR